MSYSSASDELFLADNRNRVLSSMHLRVSTNDVSVVVRGSSHVYDVCHMYDWDTLLLCSSELWHGTLGFWLVALIRNTAGNGWREANRVQCKMSRHMCALSKSRVLLGCCLECQEMEQFGVQRDYLQTNPRIAFITQIQLPEKYWWFSATTIQQSTSSDTLVAVSYKALQVVIVHRLVDDQMEELARIKFNEPVALLWLNDRILLAQNADSNEIVQLEFKDNQLKCRCNMIACNIERWCAVYNGLAIVDRFSGDLLYYSFTNK